MPTTLRGTDRPSVKWPEQLEEGPEANHSKHDDGDKKLQCRCYYQVAHILLLLLSFISLGVFCLSASALACRMLDMRANGSADVNFVGNKNTSTCYFQARPISDLWRSSWRTILIVHSTAALFMLQSLILACQLANRKFDRTGRAERMMFPIFDTEDLEPCPVHPQDYILRLTYKTSCRDDVIFKSRPPSRMGQLPSTMKQTRTQELIQSQARANQLRQDASTNRTAAYKIPVSLAGPVETVDEPFDDYRAADKEEQEWDFKD